MNKTGLTLAAAAALSLLNAQEARGEELRGRVICKEPNVFAELMMRVETEKRPPSEILKEKFENCVVANEDAKLISIDKYAEMAVENKIGVIAELDVEYNGRPQKTYALKLRDKENGPEEREH